MDEREYFAEILFPLFGVDQVLSQYRDTRPNTAETALNVRGAEVLTKRLRGGSRAGLVRYLDDRIGDLKEVIQHLQIIVDPQSPAVSVDFDVPYPELWPYLWLLDPSSNHLKWRNRTRYIRVGGSGFNLTFGKDKVQPTINWANFGPLTPGDLYLLEWQNAVAVDPDPFDSGDFVDGTFTYTPTVGYEFKRGTRKVKVVFRPSNMPPNDRKIFRPTSKVLEIEVIPDFRAVEIFVDQGGATFAPGVTMAEIAAEFILNSVAYAVEAPNEEVPGVFTVDYDSPAASYIFTESDFLNGIAVSFTLQFVATDQVQYGNAQEFLSYAYIPMIVSVDAIIASANDMTNVATASSSTIDLGSGPQSFTAFSGSIFPGSVAQGDHEDTNDPITTAFIGAPFAYYWDVVRDRAYYLFTSF